MNGKYGGFSYTVLKKKTKYDWAGIGPGEAFKANLDYYLRLPAQRMFYRHAREAQKTAAVHAGITEGTGFSPNVLPQISACYTAYPSTLAAYAGIGLSAYLEFKSRIRDTIIEVTDKDLARVTDGPEEIEIPAIAGRIAGTIAECIQARLLLKDLSRNDSLRAIEIYRIFSAANQTLRFETLPELLNAVVLFGDLFPFWENLELHPLSRKILDKLHTVSRPYLELLEECVSSEFYRLGRDWTLDIYRELVPFLPSYEAPLKRIDMVKGQLSEKLRGNASDQMDDVGADKEIRPLNAPRHPALEKRPSVEDDLMLKLMNNLSAEEKKMEAVKNSIGVESGLRGMRAKLNRFNEVLNEAGKQHSDWEDMRSDILMKIISKTPFNDDPITGSPAQGHELRVVLGENMAYSGEIFEKTVELSDDSARCEELLKKSLATTRAMRDVLYPNREMVPYVERINTSGSLDPGRLVLSDFSPAIFKLNRLREQLDKRGNPVIAIACDGSGSLNALQMSMLKILATSWINSTARSDIQVLAGLYTSGQVRDGVSGPLVSWLYHPRKTATTSRSEVVRAIASLPVSGTGCQSDALSISFIMDEARKLARGKMVYLILLTDCQWNMSFHGHESGFAEVHSLFENLQREMKEKLHTTMVALGGPEYTGMEDVIDKVIPITDKELTDGEAVAGRIGTYVASCVRERSRIGR